MKSHELIKTLALDETRATTLVQTILAGELKIDVREEAVGGPLILNYAENGRNHQRSQYGDTTGTWGVMIDGLIQAGCEPWPLEQNASGVSEKGDEEMADGRSASIFLMATKQKNVPLMQQLLGLPTAPRPSSLAKLGFEVSGGYGGRTYVNALNFLAQENEPEMARSLIKAGFHPDLRDRNGNTALMCAASTDMVRALIEEGATPWIGTPDGRTLNEYWNDRLSTSAALEFTRALTGAAKAQKREDAAWKKGRLATLLRSPTSLRNVQAAIRDAGETMESDVDLERPGIKVCHIWACALANSAFKADTVAARETVDRMVTFLHQYQEVANDAQMGKDLHILACVAQGSAWLKGHDSATRERMVGELLEHFEQRKAEGLMPAAGAVAFELLRRMMPAGTGTYLQNPNQEFFGKDDQWMLTSPHVWKLAQHVVIPDRETMVRGNNDMSILSWLASTGRNAKWNAPTSKEAWTAILPMLNVNFCEHQYNNSPSYAPPRTTAPDAAVFNTKKHPLHSMAIELLGCGHDVWDLARTDLKDRLDCVAKKTKGNYSDVEGDPQLYQALKTGYEEKLLSQLVAQPVEVRRNRM